MTDKNVFNYIILTAINWNRVTSRPQNLARCLAKKHKVLYVGMDVVPMRELLLNFIKNPIKNFKKLWTGEVKEEYENIISVHLPSLGLHSVPERIAEKIKRIFYIPQIKKILKDYKFNEEKIAAIYEGHFLGYLAGSINEDFIIYDCIDDMPELPCRDKDYVIKTEKNLIENSDAIVTVSDLLTEKCKISKKPVFKIPNGVSENFLNIQGNNAPEDFKDIPRPIIGYSGLVADWLDFDIISHCVRTKPDWSFVFVGIPDLTIPENISKYESIIKEKNVFTLGWKKYEELPSYIGKFDVCIVPFKASPLVEASDPIKIYDYLALGKPVVSTYWPELDRFEGLLKFGNNGEEFAAMIESELSEKESEAIEKRREFIRKNTWKKRAEAFDEIIISSMK